MMHGNDQNLADALGHAEDSVKARQLAEWIRKDEKRVADGDLDETSMQWLMHFIYGDYEWLSGEYDYADEQLVAAGLLTPQTQRTERCESWRTYLGGLVAAELGVRSS